MAVKRDKVIFKIVAPEDWKAAMEAGIYHGSPHDRADGFLHFSTASQLDETLRRYYPAEMAVIVVAVAANALGEALKYDHSPSRDEDFPHLYGPLPIIHEPDEARTVLATLFTHNGQQKSVLSKWSNWLGQGGDPNDEAWLTGDDMKRRGD